MRVVRASSDSELFSPPLSQMTMPSGLPPVMPPTPLISRTARRAASTMGGLKSTPNRNMPPTTRGASLPTSALPASVSGSYRVHAPSESGGSVATQWPLTQAPPPRARRQSCPVAQVVGSEQKPSTQALPRPKLAWHSPSAWQSS